MLLVRMLVRMMKVEGVKGGDDHPNREYRAATTLRLAGIVSCVFPVEISAKVPVRTIERRKVTRRG